MVIPPKKKAKVVINVDEDSESKTANKKFSAKHKFYDWAADEIGLSGDERKSFIEAATKVGKDFTLRKLQDVYDNCSRSRHENNNVEDPTIIANHNDGCSKEDLVNLEALKEDVVLASSVFCTWDCRIDDKHIAVYTNDLSVLETGDDVETGDDGKAGKRKRFEPEFLCERLKDFFSRFFIQNDVRSDGDCFIHCLWETLKDNTQYWSKLKENENKDEAVYSGGRPESVDEFVRLSRKHIGAILKDEGMGKDRLKESIQYTAENSTSDHAYGFMAKVASELCNGYPTSEAALSTILTTPGKFATICHHKCTHYSCVTNLMLLLTGSRSGMGLSVWVEETMIQYLARYWRVCVFSVEANSNLSYATYKTLADSASEIQVPQPLLCIFVMTEGGHFNYYTTKNNGLGSFNLCDVGIPLATMMKIGEEQIKWFGQNEGCPIFEKDYIHGCLVPLVQSKSISPPQLNHVVPRLWESFQSQAMTAPLCSFMHDWMRTIYRGTEPQIPSVEKQDTTQRDCHGTEPHIPSVGGQDTRQPSLASTIPLSAPTVTAHGGTLSSVCLNNATSWPTLSLFTPITFNTSDKYPFLRHISLSQPRFMENRSLNVAKLMSEDGILELFYDDSGNSDQAIRALQQDSISIVMYEICAPAEESSSFGSHVVGLTSADDDAVEAYYVGEKASSSCLEGIECLLANSPAVTSAQLSDEQKDDGMNPFSPMQRLFLLIERCYDSLRTADGLQRFRDHLLKTVPSQISRTMSRNMLPPCLDAYDCVWQAHLLLQCLHSTRFGILDGQQRQFGFNLRLFGMKLDASNPNNEIPCDIPLEGFLKVLQQRACYDLYTVPNDCTIGRALPCQDLMKCSYEIQLSVDQTSPLTSPLTAADW